jgi:hypothetical protein
MNDTEQEDDITPVEQIEAMALLAALFTSTPKLEPGSE